MFRGGGCVACTKRKLHLYIKQCLDDPPPPHVIIVMPTHYSLTASVPQKLEYILTTTKLDIETIGY